MPHPTFAFGVYGRIGQVFPNPVPGPTYTPDLSDLAGVTQFTGAAPATLIISSAIPFEVGACLTAMQTGAGAVTIVGQGVTIRRLDGLSLALAGRYAVVQLIKIGPAEWVAAGALAAS